MALGLSALVLLGVAWSLVASIRQAEEVNRRNRRIDGLRGTIGRLDEVLTMSARMGAATGDPQWETRYRRFEPELAAAIQEALSLAPDTGAADAIAHTGAANTALVEMENRAFDLIREKHLEAARVILLNGAYDGQKRLYSAGMDRLDAAFAESVRRAAEGQGQRVRMVLVVSAGALSLLGLSWFAALRSMNRGNAALVHSHEALSRQSSELAQLNAELHRYADVFRNMQVGLNVWCLQDREDLRSFKLISSNPAAAHSLGVRAEDLLGKTMAEAFPHLLDTELPRQYREVVLSGEGRDLGEVRESSSESADERIFSVKVFPLPGSCVGVAFEDITQHRRFEAQFLQAQKMEAVGRLAGGVAHDFNNTLSIVLACTELLIPNAGETQLGKLQQILKATHHASGLTRQLLAFSRKQIVDPKVLDMNALLSNLAKMLQRLIGEDIDLAIVPGVGLGHVKADPGQLEQVVMNLCVNARDAMPDGGLLRIETSNAELDEQHGGKHEAVAPGRYVMLAVSDGGCGIDKAILTQIFEPFFTTKEEGKGTGLGLAMVYGIVKQAAGYVWVYSEVGQGTTFKIYLPRIDEPPAALLVQETPKPSKGETVLLVEDEGSLRALAREILEAHGYRVLEGADANEAIEVAHRHPEPIHLLVTDVVMPGMNGRALADALVATRPEIKVLYMSGYTDDVIAHRRVLEPGTLLLAKPFTALALLGHVHAALGKRGGGESG